MALVKSPDALVNHPHIALTHALQRYHHERIDGTGYENLTGDALGKIIKAICIIDAYDGDMIHRPHQVQQRTPEEALERLKNGAKYQGAFDEEILEQFIDFTLGWNKPPYVIASPNLFGRSNLQQQSQIATSV